ncbi:Casanova [Geranomyces variabilis]|nr:Casanova [Geranomyces variabilis]
MHPQALFHHPQLSLVPRHLYENGTGQHYCMVPEGYTPVLVPNGPPPGSLPPPPQQQPPLHTVGSPFSPHSAMSFTAPPYTMLVNEALQQQQQQRQVQSPQYSNVQQQTPPAPQPAKQTQPSGPPPNQPVPLAPSKPPEAPKRIPRPSNSFMTYRMEKQHEVLAHHAGANNKDISVIIGDMWRNESEPVKEYYRKKAELGRQEHALKYPDYKYTALKPRKISSASAAVVAAAIAVGVDLSRQAETAPPKVTKATKKRRASKASCDAIVADPDGGVVAGKAKRVANRGASAEAGSSSHTSAAAAVAAAAVNAVRAAGTLRRASIKKSPRLHAGAKSLAMHTAAGADDTVSEVVTTEVLQAAPPQEALEAAQTHPTVTVNNRRQQQLRSVSAQTSPLLIDTASLGGPRSTAAMPTTTSPLMLLSSTVESAQSAYPSSVSTAQESTPTPIMDPDPPLWMTGLQRDDLTAQDAFTDDFLEALQIPTEYLDPSP